MTIGWLVGTGRAQNVDLTTHISVLQQHDIARVRRTMSIGTCAWSRKPCDLALWGKETMPDAFFGEPFREIWGKRENSELGEDSKVRKKKLAKIVWWTSPCHFSRSLCSICKPNKFGKVFHNFPGEIVFWKIGKILQSGSDQGLRWIGESLWICMPAFNNPGRDNMTMLIQCWYNADIAHLYMIHSHKHDIYTIYIHYEWTPLARCNECLFQLYG